MMGSYRFGSGGQKMWFALAAVTFATARGFNVASISQSVYWLGRTALVTRVAKGTAYAKPIRTS